MKRLTKFQEAQLAHLCNGEKWLRYHNGVRYFRADAIERCLTVMFDREYITERTTDHGRAIDGFDITDVGRAYVEKYKCTDALIDVLKPCPLTEFQIAQLVYLYENDDFCGGYQVSNHRQVFTWTRLAEMYFNLFAHHYTYRSDPGTRITPEGRAFVESLSEEQKNKWVLV